MKEKGRELTTLWFKGSRFEDGGLEIDVLQELIAYKRLLIETAEELWRKGNPDRERLPAGFRNQIDIKFYTLSKGSTTVPLMRVDRLEEGILPLPIDGDEFDRAADLIEEGIEAASNNHPLPDELPRGILQFFGELGKSLREDEAIEAKSPRRNKRVSYCTPVRERLLSFVKGSYSDIVELTGVVRAADLDGLSFNIRSENHGKIRGKFLPEQEEVITEALKNHDSLRLRLRGSGEFDPTTGAVVRLARVEDVQLEPLGETTFDPDERPIWEVVAELGAQVSDKAWESVPTDLSRDLDHYLYGSPRDEE